jgi:ATP-dependent Clp protease ATP-binding subunit ClpC
MSMGMMARGKWLYFSIPFTKYHINLRQFRYWLRNFEVLGTIVFTVGFFAFAFYHSFSSASLVRFIYYDFWSNIDYVSDLGLVMFMLSFVSATYLMYLILSSKDKYKSVEKDEIYEQERNFLEDYVPVDVNTGWEQFYKMLGKNKIDISRSFTSEAISVLENAFKVASKYKNKSVTPLHIFYSLLSVDRVKSVFLRLGVPTKKLQAKIGKIFEKEHVDVEPILSPEANQIIFHAYENAYRTRQEYVHSTEFIVATVQESEEIQEILYDLNIDSQKMENVVGWAKVREFLRDSYRKFRQAATHISKHGIDKAMTAVATPYLNKFSQDLTLAAKFGHLAPCVARDKEIEDVLRIIEGGKSSVVLVGDHGVGKMTIIEGITQRMVQGTVPERLRDKRLVQLSTSALVAGVTTSGAQQRLIRMMSEIHRAGNIVLFINNIHDLVGLSESNGQEGLDISESLAEYLGTGSVVTFATATTGGYNKSIISSSLGSIISKISIDEMDENQAIQALESSIGQIEYENNVFFSYDALSKSVQLASKLLHDQTLPGSALGVAREAAAYVKNKKQNNIIVKAEDVAKIISNKTGVPTESISESESQKLLRLEDEMHKRVIGQDEAVKLVANALRRSRAEVRSTKKPISTFLFLGPTGVGKTELAKTISSVYFGGENRMIRIDMSEFQDKTGIYRLIGQPGRKGTGLLTEAVRQQPFSLVLLDEMEKADLDVLNLFLQVFDDGRLTDSVGRVIDFTNTIIISTSNAGTSHVNKRLEEGAKMEDIRQELIKSELKNYYRPEFLNRFDGIVLFKSLERGEIKQIASIMLKRVAKDLEQRGVELRVEDSALEALSVAGFDPQFGARPMRRAIQEKVENQLAELILSGQLQRRDIVVLGDDAKIRIER